MGSWTKNSESFHHFISCVLSYQEGSKFNTATLDRFSVHIYIYYCVWPCFLVRASIGPIQWGVGWLPIHNQFVFYGLGTLGLEHLRGRNMLKHVFAVKPQFELQLTNFWLCCCKIRCWNNDTLSWRVEGGVEDNLPNVWFFNIKNIPNVPKLVNSTEQSNLQLLQSSISSEMFQPAQS